MGSFHTYHINNCNSLIEMLMGFYQFPYEFHDYIASMCTMLDVP